MNETMENRRFTLTSVMMLLFSLSGILLLWFYKSIDISGIISFLLVVLISDLCMIFYIGFKAMNIFVKKSAFWIITIIYGLTFLAICFPISLTIHTSVFFIGAILIAYIIDINLGLIFSCMFFVFSCIINKEITMDVLFFFLISLLLSILVQTIKGFLSVLLIECITAVLFMVFGLILYEYQWSALLNPILLFSFAFYFVVVLLAFFLHQILNDSSASNQVKARVISSESAVSDSENFTRSSQITETESGNTTAIDQNSRAESLKNNTEKSRTDRKVSWVTAQGTPFITLQEISPDTTASVQAEDDLEAHTLEEILSADFILMQRMKSEANRLFKHSTEVADLSARVAQKTNTNSTLAYAGAMYHEIGRLTGSNLLEESVNIAKEYHLPAAVINILKQHNYKNELPQSMEAVIVMLSDNIITMYHFMKKQEKDVSIVKLIDNTFHMHFNKGTIEASGITINQFNQLRKAYLSELVFDDDFMKGGNNE